MLMRFVLCIFLTVITATAAFQPHTTVQVDKPSAITEKVIDVPAICQHPTLPTGCEAVCATMVLRYYGVTVTAAEFAGEWLSCSNEFYMSNGKLYGPDPNEVFIGNPFTDTAHGCFATPIVNAINDNCNDVTAEKITGRTLAELCEAFINADKPLLIWATVDMKEPTKGNRWYLQDGTLLQWLSGEHCLVLIGYTADCYLLNDPTTGSVVSYEKELVEQRFAAMGSQAVYIKMKNEK